MKKIIFVFSAAIFLIHLSGCCNLCGAEQPAAVKKHPIYGNWKIEDLPAATAKKIKPAPNAAITFERGKVYGCAGDNRFFGNLKVYGRKLSFSHMGMTRMMGPNARYEGLFMEALNQVTQFAVDGNIRLLNKEGKTVMILRRTPQREGK